MKERPIIFSTDMVRAILAGLKTQTRRIASFIPLHEGLNFGWSGLKAGHYFTDAPEHGWVLRARRGDGCWEDKTDRSFCRYGLPGDRLWVRETWAVSKEFDRLPGSKIPEAGHEKVWYLADGPKPEWAGRTRSARFMPRWASRIVLDVVNLRLERVQKITPADVVAEGIIKTEDGSYLGPDGYPHGHAWEAFSRLWDSINAKRGYSFDSNPWVWVIEFKRV
jgi:hypothetical protein